MLSVPTTRVEHKKQKENEMKLGIGTLNDWLPKIGSYVKQAKTIKSNEKAIVTLPIPV